MLALYTKRRCPSAGALADGKSGVQSRQLLFPAEGTPQRDFPTLQFCLGWLASPAQRRGRFNLLSPLESDLQRELSLSGRT